MSQSDEDISSLEDEAENHEEEEEETEEEASPDEDAIDPRSEVPKDIELESLVVGIDFHPKRNLLAAGTVAGPVRLYSYAADAGNREVLTYEHLKKPCRDVQFSPSGDHLFTGAQDGVIHVMDLATHSVFRKFCRTDGSSLYCLLPIDDYLLASGEDDGQVVVWDFRMQAPVACFEESNEFISSLSVSGDKKTLLSTCAEGTLSAFNVKARKLEMRSEMFDSDFLCSGIFKKGSKVVVGAGDGSLNIFNWGEYGNISDRFPGHPGSVECMAVISDDVVCTGCEDGRVRAVQLFPTRFLGVLGSHHGFPIDDVTVSFDSTLIASTSYDQKIKFWDLSGVEDAKTEDVKETKQKHKNVNKQVNNFFADLEEEEDDE